MAQKPQELHYINVSYIEGLELGAGDTIQVYRSNMVIPKVHDNLTRSNTFKIPDTCPTCGGEAKIINENDSKVLKCMNPDMQGKTIKQICEFCFQRCNECSRFI